jgi:hypothetical protein
MAVAFEFHLTKVEHSRRVWTYTDGADVLILAESLISYDYGFRVVVRFLLAS